MIPTYRSSVSSPMPLDLSEDQNHLLFSPHHQASSSSSSLSYPVLFNPDQDQAGSCYWEQKHLKTDEEAEKTIPNSSGSWDYAAEKDESNSGLKLRVWKKEDRNENHQAEEDGSAVKWMPSKMRMMRKMMVSDQTGSDMPGNSMQKFEDQKQPLSPLGTDNSSNSSSNHSNITVRVCADCHTTKTPLWRRGPRGPKSLCNACGIRQRKARRAMAAAAASENSSILAAETHPVKGNKLHNKQKKPKIGCAPQLKKKRKLGAKPSRGRKKFGFEDFTISLTKNLSLQQVFPQDEKEAAILLMALSYGLVHG